MSIPVSDVAVMDQFAVSRQASDMLEVQTPLAHAGLSARAGKSSLSEIAGSKAAAGKGESTVLLEEVSLTGMLTLRAVAASGELSKALQSVLELELPERLRSHTNGKGECIRWMSPDEWMLTCPIEQTFSVEQELRTAISGHIAIVNVSGGYCLLTLSGADAKNVLAKSTSYNLNSENFVCGKVVNTMMAKAQVTLRAVSDGRYEILVRRSFADYLWLWLQRAGREYGLQAVTVNA